MYSDLILGAWIVSVTLVSGKWEFNAEQDTDQHTTVSMTCKEGGPGVQLGVKLHVKAVKKGARATFADMEAPCKMLPDKSAYFCAFEPKDPVALIHRFESFQSIPVYPTANAKNPNFEVKLSNQRVDIVLRQADLYCRGLVSKLPFPNPRGL